MEYFDAKSNERPPLLSDDALVELTYVKEDGRRPSEQVRDFYEAARAKDAETIQMLLDAFNDCCDDLSGVLGLIPAIDGHVLNLAVGVYQEVINEAAKEGFKPTYP